MPVSVGDIRRWERTYEPMAEHRTFVVLEFYEVGPEIRAICFTSAGGELSAPAGDVAAHSKLLAEASPRAGGPGAV